MAETKTDNPVEGLKIEAAAPQKPQPSAEPAKAQAKAKDKKKTADKGGYWWGTGRRKRAVARVRIRPGDGKVQINKKTLKDYFPRKQDRNAVLAPLKAVDAEKTIDIFVNVKGGGSTGQSGASLMGVARALLNYNESFTQTLRDGGYLTRDSRMVERKKPGQRGARRKFQFSKR